MLFHLKYHSFFLMLEPLRMRREKLDEAKQIRQFFLDLEDEKMWISEKMLQATSTDFGKSQLSVQMLQKKNKSLQNDIDQHEPHFESVIGKGEQIIDRNHPRSDEIKPLIDQLKLDWQNLLDAAKNRKLNLDESEVTQQVVLDWILLECSFFFKIIVFEVSKFYGNSFMLDKLIIVIIPIILWIGCNTVELLLCHGVPSRKSHAMLNWLYFSGVYQMTPLNGQLHVDCSHQSFNCLPQLQHLVALVPKFMTPKSGWGLRSFSRKWSSLVI